MSRTKLTDLQMILLSTASQREDGSVFPLKECIKDKQAEVAKGAATLLKRDLITEQPITDLAQMYCEADDQRIGLFLTDAGRAVIDGVSADGTADDGAAGTEPSTAADPAKTVRTGSKIERVIELLRREGGATSAELVEMTGWLPHTMRAVLTGLRKKGHIIDRGKRDDQTCYHIAAKA